MHLHEFQVKDLFRQYGIPVPGGQAARSVKEAREAAATLETDALVVKAQVHSGGRGKAGGVRLVQGTEALVEAVDSLLGTRLVTTQSGAPGLPVNAVLVEESTVVARELYLGIVVDRDRERVAVMASAKGGMDIETVAAEDPDAIVTAHVHPTVGLQPYQCRHVGYALGLEGAAVKALARVMTALYRLYVELDGSMLEINPLGVTRDGGLVAMDAKLDLDENAMMRQQRLASWRDDSQEDERERTARRFELNYVTLDGEIACMVNGAGLAMATMDLIQHHGGRPANFLDVGGGTTVERVTEAFKLISSDTKVRAILVNIFGGIVRCDLIAQGIVRAVREVGVRVPVVVRLEGTNQEEGKAQLRDSGLDIITGDDLTDAARRVVAAARTGGRTS